VSEQLYMPLTWTRNDGGWWTGEGLLGASYNVGDAPRGIYWRPHGGNRAYADSLEAAKAAAEAHYRQRLEQMLEKAAPSPQEKP
jgi:hypothetical protein